MNSANISLESGMGVRTIPEYEKDIELDAEKNSNRYLKYFISIISTQVFKIVSWKPTNL